MGLVDHLERYLGEIEVGWTHDADGKKMLIEVARFKKGIGPGTVAFATIGLSRWPLVSTASKKVIRQEFIMVVPNDLRDGPIPGLLEQVALEVIESRTPLLRGQVVGPRGRLFAGSRMEALYVAIPVILPDEFGTVVQDGHQVIIAWLIPVTAEEARCVSLAGWDAFEDRLVALDPDLTDLRRASIPCSMQDD